MITALALLACSNGLSEDSVKIEPTQSNPSMNNDQLTTAPFLIRTYFIGGTDWNDLTEKFLAKYELGFSANLKVIDNPNNENLSIDQIIKSLPEGHPFDILFVADSLTFTQSDNTVLCVDLFDEPGRFFRVIPSELWSVENNLSIANMDYLDFYENCDENGIFRGFE